MICRVSGPGPSSKWAVEWMVHLSFFFSAFFSSFSNLSPAPVIDSRSSCKSLLAILPSLIPFQRFLLVVFPSVIYRSSSEGLNIFGGGVISNRRLQTPSARPAILPVRNIAWLYFLSTLWSHPASSG